MWYLAGFLGPWSTDLFYLACCPASCPYQYLPSFGVNDLRRVSFGTAGAAIANFRSYRLSVSCDSVPA